MEATVTRCECGEPITEYEGLWVHAGFRIPCDWEAFCADGPWWEGEDAENMAVDLYPGPKARPAG